MIPPFHMPKPIYFQPAPCQSPTSRNTKKEETAAGKTLDTYFPYRDYPNFVVPIQWLGPLRKLDIPSG